MKLSEKILNDKYVEAGLVPDNFTSFWHDSADWQFNALTNYGLKSHHKLLDVGCGPLRLGLKAIEFLEDGNYCGVDAYKKYIDLGDNLTAYLEIKNKYQTIHTTLFEFDKFNLKFDYAFAQSVVTHLSPEQIKLCLSNMKKVMNKGGQFLFTYNTHPYSRGILYYDLPMVAPVGCDEEFLESVAVENGIEFIPLDYSHASKQKVAIFKF
tara:strand:+ start:3284 stop:3910 length:627 start_codon:yes stop_codon:yes gene_type:complete